MFGTPVATQDPKFVETILGKTGSQNLYDRAFNNSLFNTALMWAAMPKNEGYGSAFDPRYLIRAGVFGGIPAYQSTIGQGVENFKTMRDIQQQERQFGLEQEKLKPTSFAEWERYTQDAESRGQKPMSYESWKRMAYELTPYQKQMLEYQTGYTGTGSSINGGLSVVAPDGKTYVFDSVEKANAFRNRIGGQQ